MLRSLSINSKGKIIYNRTAQSLRPAGNVLLPPKRGGGGMIQQFTEFEVEIRRMDLKIKK